MIFKGVFAIMTTPFEKSGEIDYGILREKARFLIKIGADGLIPTGSVGECFTLTNEEKIKIWENVLEEANGEVPVLGSTNHTCTNTAKALCESAEKIGLDGVMNLPPYYWPVNDKVILRHYGILNDAISIPIMVYNNLKVTGIDMSPGLINSLAELDNIKAIKETTPYFQKLEQVFRLVGEKISVFNGLSVLNEPYATMMGCQGMNDPLINFLGPTIIAIKKYAIEKKYDEAFQLKRLAVSPITDYIFSFSTSINTVAAYKYIEFKLGMLPNCIMRIPGYELTEEQKETIDTILINTEKYRIKM